jgi:hypothetical protein
LNHAATTGDPVSGAAQQEMRTLWGRHTPRRK